MPAKKPRAVQPASAPPVKIPARPTPPDQIPRIVREPTLDDHLEIMTRAIFQAGLSWALIAARWEKFRAGFDGFDVRRVAAYGEADVERLMETDGIIHSRSKIAGTVANAATLLAVAAEFGSVEAYAARFEDYDALYADAHARFKHVGDLSCYYWRFRTGGTVPRFEEWMKRHTVDHPRMREMVLAGRADGMSPERP